MSDKILLVDDDPAVRRMLVLLLETTAEILEAATGELALLAVTAERPRLMLLDMVMPGMGGLETLKAARVIAPAMTVIVLTGKNDIDAAKRALESGASEYVTKPFDLSRLKEKVKRIMENVSGDDRNDSGLPWRVAAPRSPEAHVPERLPASAAIARWEGEGGGLAMNAAPNGPRAAAAPKIRLIGRDELKAKLDDREHLHLWNVRQDAGEPEADIAGSAWISADAITAKRVSEKVSTLGETIVVYSVGPECPSSKRAAEKLQSLGYTNVFVYEGGLKDWLQHGFLLVNRSCETNLMDIE